MEFNKDQYIVYTGVNLPNFSKNHCYKQKAQSKYLAVYVDDQGDSWDTHLVNVSDNHNWRYATNEECAAYKGKPFNVGEIDGFSEGDYIVLTHGDNSAYYKHNHCYKIGKASILINILEDSAGRKNRSITIQYKHTDKWRQAKPHEINTYNKLGCPFNTKSIKNKPHDLIEKTVHTKSLAEAKAFCLLMHNAGAKWAYRNSTLEDHTGYEGANTCYYITSDGTINTGRLSDAQEKNITIIKGKDFLINNIYSKFSKNGKQDIEAVNERGPRSSPRSISRKTSRGFLHSSPKIYRGQAERTPRSQGRRGR